MGDAAENPVDDSRAAGEHSSESGKSVFNAPGLGLLAVAIAAMIVALVSFITEHPAAGVAATGASALAFFAGGGWLYVAYRQVREQQARGVARHPDADAPPPKC